MIFIQASDVEDSFNDLMEYGFKSRVTDGRTDSFLRSAAKQITSEFDLNKSKEQQVVLNLILLDNNEELML